MESNLLCIDGFQGAWLHFRRTKVCVWVLLQLCAKYRVVSATLHEYLPLVLKDKRSCSSQGERSAVQLPFDRAFALRKWDT